MVLGRKQRWEHNAVMDNTLNSGYIEVAFNEKSAITKQNLRTKCFPLTAMLNILPIMKSLYEIATYNDFLGT